MVKNNKQKQMAAREMVRNYKEVITQVNETREPIILTAGMVKVAIISMDDFKTLQDLRYKNSANALLEFGYKAQSLLKDANLPSDLSTNHNRYFFEDE